MTRSSGSIRTIFVHDDGPYAVVWECGPMIYLHEWVDDRLGRLLDARLLADHLRVRAVHAAALEWLVAPSPDEYGEEFDGEEFDDDERGDDVFDGTTSLTGVGGHVDDEHNFVATIAVRGAGGHVYLRRDDRFVCVKCDAAFLDWRTPAGTETCRERMDLPADLVVG